MNHALFVLGRHGRTAGNEKNIYRSWSNADYAQLNDVGKQDAHELGIFLKGLNIPFSIVLTDDLDRTNDTADIVMKILGITDKVVDKRLRPLNMGDWTGKSKDKFPTDEYLKDTNKKIPGGESVKQFNKRQATVFADIAETVAQTKAPILVIGHGSNGSFLNNHANHKGEFIGYEGLTYPGGASVFTKDGIKPIFKPRDQKKQKLVKISQSVVLYMDAKDIGKSKGAHCDDCIMFISTGKCAAVAGSIDGEKGICGLYVFGTPNHFTESGTLSKETAGYVESGPTHCESCEYFGGEGNCAKVETSPKTIEAGGCCNAYEKEK